MMRDRSVPAGTKALALGMGVGITGLLVALELPVETIVGVFLPLIGSVGDALFDGFEMVMGPLLFASLLLPYLVAQTEARAAAVARAPKMLNR